MYRQWSIIILYNYAASLHRLVLFCCLLTCNLTTPAGDIGSVAVCHRPGRIAFDGVRDGSQGVKYSYIALFSAGKLRNVFDTNSGRLRTVVTLANRRVDTAMGVFKGIATRASGICLRGYHGRWDGDCAVEKASSDDGRR